MGHAHDELLLAMIDRLLSGDMSFKDFSRDYYSYYLDGLPDEALTDQQHEFFSAVHERLDWTGEAPDEESRRYGWMDPGEYIDWLRGQRALYGRGWVSPPESRESPAGR
jgi:hypothetical protein